MKMNKKGLALSEQMVSEVEPRNESKGFTLVELLVVITIVTILGAIGASAYGITQQNARDGKSKADLVQMAKSMEAARTIDTTTGAVTYTYSSADQTSDFKTVPTGKNAYCLYAVSSGTVTLPTTSWTTTCPGTPAWPNNSTSWAICTSLERGGIKCETSISK